MNSRLAWTTRDKVAKGVRKQSRRAKRSSKGTVSGEAPAQPDAREDGSFIDSSEGISLELKECISASRKKGELESQILPFPGQCLTPRPKNTLLEGHRGEILVSKHMETGDCANIWQTTLKVHLETHEVHPTWDACTTICHSLYS